MRSNFRVPTGSDGRDVATSPIVGALAPQPDAGDGPEDDSASPEASDDADRLLRWYLKQPDDVCRRNAILEHYLPVVHRIAARLAARRTLPPSVAIEDLVSFGVLGLMDALPRFDESKGTRFLAFAESRIRGAMFDNLRTWDYFSRNTRRRVNSLLEAEASFAAQHGHAPTVEELACSGELNEEEVSATLQLARARRISAFSDDVDEVGTNHEPADTREPLPGEALESSDAFDRLRRYCNAHERLVLLLYYKEGLTQREIGDALGLTASAIQGIHEQALRWLRAAVGRNGNGQPGTAR